MSFAYGMILIAAILPYIAVGLAKGSGSGYDNTRPRLWAGMQSDWRQRAIAAHQNHFEAFAPFAAGVIVASLSHAPALMTNILAGGFILLRIFYTLAYLYNRATLRSVLWSLGFLCVITLFCIGA